MTGRNVRDASGRDEIAEHNTTGRSQLAVVETQAGELETVSQSITQSMTAVITNPTTPAAAHYVRWHRAVQQ